MKEKSITIFVIIVVVLSMSATPIVVASEHNQVEQNQTDENVTVGVGQSMSIAVDGVSAEVRDQVDDIAREKALGEASSESERAEVLSNDLDQTVDQARSINNKYQSIVKSYKNGNITKSELVTELSKLSNNADKVQENLDNIQYASQFIPEQELNQKEVSQEKIDNARKEVGVVGGNVAKVARRTALDPNSKMNLNADEKGLELAVEKSDGRAYNGVDREETDHGVFNISEEKAVQALATEYEFNQSEYEVSVEKDDDGYYEVEAENETVSYEATIDGRDGSIVSFERDEDNDRRGPPEDSDSPEDDPGRDNVNGGPPEWADDSEELTIETDGEIQPNSTVNLTVTDSNGTAVGQANISINGKLIGETDSEGRLEVQIPNEEDVEITAEKGELEGELEYESEEDEDEGDDRRDPPEDIPRGEDDESEDDESEDDEQENSEQEDSGQEEEPEGEEDDKSEDGESELRISVENRGNESVDILVDRGDNATVEGAEVRVNGELVGETDSDGLLTIDLPDSEDVSIVAEKDGEEAEYEIENQEDGEDQNEDESDLYDQEEDGSEEDDSEEDDQEEDGSEEDDSEEDDQETGSNGRTQRGGR